MKLYNFDTVHPLPNQLKLEVKMTLKNALLLICLGFLLFACCPDTEEQLKANKSLIMTFVEATNNADWAAFDSLLTDDFTRHCDATSGVVIDSREAFVELQEGFLASTPDQEIITEFMLAEGDMVAAYATYAGTQTGPLGDLPASGKYAEMKFITIFRIENGQIAELWVEWDNMAMLMQLGHFPPPADTVTGN
jgi:steroid delta-isomerase-like uncharacterized protein